MVTTFYPPHIGGIEYHVENLSKELVKRGHSITILTSMLPKMDLPKIETNPYGIDVIRVKAFFPFGKLYPSLSSQGIMLNLGKIIRQLAKTKKLEIIHLHGHHYYLTWTTIDIARKLGIPSILTIHGLYALNPGNGIADIEEEIFNRTIFKRELSKVSVTIGLTARITDYAKKFDYKSKKITIPNGVNYRIFSINRKNKYLYRQKYNIQNDATVVLYIGRFATIKGICELAEAAKHVIASNEKVIFIFAGGGPLTAELIKILQSVQDKVRIIGWTPVDEIHELYLASDIFVLPSKSEALPLTILEAMAAKLYIIATPVGGIPEILENYPYKLLINHCSSDEIYRAILCIVSHNVPPLKDDSFFNSYMANFDWEKIAYQVERAYLYVSGK